LQFEVLPFGAIVTRRFCADRTGSGARILSLALSVALGASVSTAVAQPANEPIQPYSFQQAMERAVADNPSLAATRARLGISEADIRAAAFHPNPSFLTSYTPAEDLYRIGVQQTFQLGFKRERRIAFARAQRDVVRAEINVAILDLRAELRRAFTKLYVAQQRASLLKDIYDTTQRLLEVAAIREHAGDIPQFEVLQAQVVSLNAQNDYQLAQYQVVEARASLNAVLGRPGWEELQVGLPDTAPRLPVHLPSAPASVMAPLQARVSITDANLTSLIEQGLKVRPELEQNRASVLAAQRQATLARANVFPNATISYGRDINYKEKESFMFFAANVEIPLWYQQQGEIRGAIARRAQLLREQTALQNRIRSEITAAYAAFVGQRRRLDIYERELLPQSETLVQKARRSFELGKSPILIPITAQQAYVNTRQGYLQALADYQNAITDLERAVGVVL
jgi:cobalt-zinc-cadmium efflux system outer membrane protein